MCYDLIMLWLTLVCCQQLAEPPPVFYQAPAFDDVVFWLQTAGAMGCVGGQLSLHGVCVWHWAQEPLPQDFAVEPRCWLGLSSSIPMHSDRAGS